MIPSPEPKSGLDSWPIGAAFPARMRYSRQPKDGLESRFKVLAVSGFQWRPVGWGMMEIHIFQSSMNATGGPWFRNAVLG
jgi:hypothetical protein